jgi:microsomal epoxide hydrolase
MRTACAIASILLLLGFGRPAAAGQDRYFVTDDGVRLHYLEAWPTTHTPARDTKTIVFVPGWTMPAWIFDQQIAAFSTAYHVVAFDPRGQGDSAAPPDGYEPGRRGQDIANLLAHLATGPALLVGWSLGVLDALAYLHQDGDARLAGLVLIDNSVGEDPPPPPPRPGKVPPAKGPKPSRAVAMRNFVQGMFVHRQSAAYLDRLTEACLRTPAPAAAALLAYPVPRTYWREAVYSTAKPVLYVVRPRLAGQAGNLAAHHPGAETVVLGDVGHALFVDESVQFDTILQDFIRRRIWH